MNMIITSQERSLELVNHTLRKKGLPRLYCGSEANASEPQESLEDQQVRDFHSLNMNSLETNDFKRKSRDNDLPSTLPVFSNQETIRRDFWEIRNFWKIFKNCWIMINKCPYEHSCHSSHPYTKTHGKRTNPHPSKDSFDISQNISAWEFPEN